MAENVRLIWPDLLKIISILAVIFIHTSSPLLVQYHQLGETQWWIGNLYNSASRWCVPLFVMLSGALLLDKFDKSSMQYFFKRRFRKVVIPFLFWSGVYFLWTIYGNHKAGLSIADFLKNIFIKPIYYHLWFFYIIMGLYLVTPILAVYVKNADRKNMRYMLMLWFVLFSLLPFIEIATNVRTYFSTGVTNSTLKFLGYFVLGYYMREAHYKFHPVTCISLFFLSFFITAFGTYYLTVVKNGGNFSHLFYEYFSFNVFFMAVSIFAIGTNIKLPKYLLKVEEKTKIISRTSRSVLGVYLVHAVLIEISKDGSMGFEFSQVSIHPALGIPVFSLGLFLTSLIIVFILKVIPFIKNTVP